MRSTRFALLIFVASVAGHACAAEEALPDHLTIGDARVNIDIAEGLAGSRAILLTWISNSADTVAGYYGQFPNKSVALRVVARPGEGVQGGVTTNRSGAAIAVRVGTAVTQEQLNSDWVLVHEMIHLASPDFYRRYEWLSEGLSTYVEGIARAQAGRLDAREVWSDYLHSMPQGIPKEGEGGQNQTPTWARTYWGGALFCLLADVSIREHSKNKYSLRDALIAISNTTGGYAPPPHQRIFTVEETFRVGDAATHSTELMDLYNAMKETPMRPDLPALWKRLGVRAEGNSVVFDDSAPLAYVRKAMTSRR